MEPGIYVYSEEVQIWWLRWIGYILSFGKVPVHTCLYVKLAASGYCFRLELTSEPPTQKTRTVGRGDGYTIQITRVEENEVKGDYVGNCSPLAAMVVTENYASTENGDLSYTGAERGWYDEPQGCGGPMFDRCTCNTFTSYVLKKAVLDGELPPRPRGAIGWGQKPKFPGPVF